MRLRVNEYMRTIADKRVSVKKRFSSLVSRMIRFQRDGGEPMKANEAEAWYEIRDGEYYCKECEQLLVGQTVKEAFVLDAPTEGAYYRCDKCQRSEILPVLPH